MTHEEAVQKVAKLLRLATSDNANEAALAASRAQDIIDRYKLTGMTLDLEGKPSEPEEPIKRFDAPLNEEDRGAGQLQRWKGYLALDLAKCNQCRVYKSGPNLRIIGRASDAETVRYLYAYLVQEIERLAKRDGAGNGRTWTNNFRIGCAETVGKRLHEQHNATIEAVKAEARAEVSNPHAIVRVEQSIVRIEQRAKAVDDWVETNVKLSKGRSSYSRHHEGAREAGRRAGKEINLSSKGAMGAGQRYLP